METERTQNTVMFFMFFQRKIMGIMVENDGDIIQYNMSS